MSNYLFAGGTLDTLLPKTGACSFYTGDNDVLDPVYSDGYVDTQVGGVVYGNFREPVLLGEEVWVHFRMGYADVRDNSSNCWTHTFFRLSETDTPAAIPIGLQFCPDSAKDQNFAIIRGSDGAGGYGVADGRFDYTQDADYTFDIHANLDPVLGFIKVYLGGSLILAWYGDTTCAGTVSLWDKLELIGPTSSGSIIDNTHNWSEVIVSRTSTIGLRLATLRPTADATPADWVGTFENVNDLSPDDGTSISTDVPDTTHLMEFSDLNAALPSDLSIAAIITSAKIANSSGTVSGVQHVIKGASETLSETKGISASSSLSQIAWDLNPETGLPWELAEINALDIGFKSKE